MKRPLAWMGFSASAALLFAGWGGLSVAMGVLIAAGVAVIASLMLWRWKRLSALLLLAVTVAGTMIALLVNERMVFAPQEEFAGKTLPVTVELQEKAANYRHSTLFAAEVVTGELPVGTRLQVWVVNDLEVDVYDRVTGEMELYPVDTSSVYYRQNKAEGILLTGTLNSYDQPVKVTDSEESLEKQIYEVRHAAVGVMEEYLSGDTAGIVRSLCLGNYERLPDRVADAFRGSGTSHLLVVSGLHLNMVAAAVLAFLRFCRVGRRPSAIVAMLAVAGFMCLAGFTPSVIRAGVMSLVMLAGTLFKREADGLNSLGLALLLLALADPYMVFDVRLQLSAASVLGVMLVYPPMEKRLVLWLRESPRLWRRLLYRPARAACLSLAATLLVAPLLGWYFGELSLAFIPANLLMVFPATIAVVAGLLGVLTGGWCPPLGDTCFYVAGLVVNYLYKVAEWLAGFPFSTIYVRYEYVAVWALLLVLLLWVCRRYLSAVKRVTTLLLATAVLMVSSMAHTAAMGEITFCHVLRQEKSMAALMTWDEGTLLFVTGTEPTLLTRTLTLLRHQRVERLSVLVLPDLDDNALSALPLLSDAIAIDRIICPATGEHAPSIQELFDENGCTMADEVTFTVGKTHTFSMREGRLFATTGDTTWVLTAVHAPYCRELTANGVIYPAFAYHTTHTDCSLGLSGDRPAGNIPWLLLPPGEQVTLFTHEDGTVYCQ